MATSTAATPKRPRGRKKPGRTNALTRPPKLPLEHLVEVERRMCMMQRERKIVEDLALLWNIPKTTIKRYLEAVRAEWLKLRPMQIEQRRVFLRSALEEIVSRSFALDDMRAATLAVDKLCKLDGLYEPERVEHGIVGSLGTVEVGNPDAVRARIAELQQRVGLLPAASASPKP